MTEISDKEHIAWLAKWVAELLGKLYKNKTIEEQIKAVPINNTYFADRYDTDDQIVIHFWKDKESYDIKFSK